MNRQEYNDEEISEILRRAANIQGKEELDRAILERTAEELGISPEAVRQAEEEFQQTRVTYEEQQALKQEQKAFTRHKWQEFYEHLATYLAVNSFLFFIDYRKDHSLSWVFYPLLGWGIGMVIHLVSMFRPFENEELDKEFTKWRKARNKGQKGKTA